MRQLQNQSRYEYAGDPEGSVKNVGWRIDYFFISDDLKDNLVDSYILPDVMGSDHCTIALKIKI